MCVCEPVWKIIEDTVDRRIGALGAPLGRYVLIEVYLSNNKYNNSARLGSVVWNLHLFIKFTVPFLRPFVPGETQVRNKFS